MKKMCKNCDNYTIFYTKIGGYYFQTNCGRCWANKTINAREDACLRWEAKNASDNVEQEQSELIKAFDTVISSLSTIKERLKDE